MVAEYKASVSAKVGISGTSLVCRGHLVQGLLSPHNGYTLLQKAIVMKPC